MKTVIVIPTYNERENIASLIREVCCHVPDISILVVDDDSPDGTADVVRGMQGQFPGLSLLLRKKKEGLGMAYAHAFQEILSKTETDRIVTMDADFSHDPKKLPEMLQRSQKFDVVVGSRYVSNGKTEGWQLWRRVLSRGGNFYCRLITRMPVSDCTAGFMALNTKILGKIDLSEIDTSGYAFQIELKFLLWKAGATFSEIPILFKNRVRGESKISSHIIREGIMAPWKLLLKR